MGTKSNNNGEWMHLAVGTVGSPSLVGDAGLARLRRPVRVTP